MILRLPSFHFKPIKAKEIFCLKNKKNADFPFCPEGERPSRLSSPRSLALLRVGGHSQDWHPRQTSVGGQTAVYFLA